MQKKKGISLIVLVITIIVMIILAGAIILSLNNAGIIGKANEAVSSSNEANVKQLADLKWAEAYLNEDVEKTDKAMREYVIGKLKEEIGEQELLAYDVQVTTQGVTVEKLITTAELQEKYVFKYYSSLAKAVEDVNAGTVGTENSVADRDKTNAFAGIYRDGDNITIVILKDAIGEHALKDAVRISENVTINLGGCTLEFISQLGIAGNSSDDTHHIIIDGRLKGSKIELNSNTSMTRLLQTGNDNFVIKGGTYIANTAKQASGEQFAAQVVQVNANAGSKIKISDANMMVNMLYEGTGETITADHLIVSCINAYGEIEINNCVLTTDDTKLPDGIKYNKRFNIKGVEAQGNAKIKGTTINVMSKVDVNPGEQQHKFVFGVDAAEYVVMEDSSIAIDSHSTETAYVRGVLVYKGSELLRTDIFIDAVGATASSGVLNSEDAITKLTDCNISGADNAWDNNGTLYVNGVEQAKTVALIPQNLLERRKYC